MENNKDTLKEPVSMRQRPQNEPFDLIGFFYVLLSHLWQIVLCLIIGGAIAFLYTYITFTPQYTASSKIYMVPASSSSVNMSDLQLGSQLMGDYQQLMYNRPLLEDVVENLSLDMSYGQLASMFTVSNQEGTRILKISATSQDPKQAMDIANELADQAVIYLPRIMKCEPPTLMEEAILPGAPSDPGYSRNVLKGAIVLCGLYVAVLLLRFIMNDTFVTQDDLERYFGVRPLAVIPEANIERSHKKKSKFGFGKRKIDN